MKKISFYMLLLSAIVLGGTACGDEHNFLQNVSPVATGARIKVFHGAADVAGVVVRANDQLLSGVLTVPPAAINLINYGSFFPLSEYSVVPAGTTKIKITALATATAAEASYSVDATLQDNKYYTVHVLGVSPNYTFVVSEDDLTVPDANKTYVRFINLLSSTTGAGVEFLVNNTVTVTKTAVSDGKEQFIALDQPGSNRFTIVVRETGKTAALSTLTSLNFVRGKKYTVIARGVFGNTTTAKPALTQFSNN